MRLNGEYIDKSPASQIFVLLSYVSFSRDSVEISKMSHTVLRFTMIPKIRLQSELSSDSHKITLINTTVSFLFLLRNLRNILDKVDTKKKHNLDPH